MSEQNQYGQGRDLADRILERVASDPQFREELVRNPERALGAAFGYGETLQPGITETGHLRPQRQCGGPTCGFTCLGDTCGWSLFLVPQ